MLNEVVAKNKRTFPYHKKAKRLSDIQKSITFSTTAVLKMADELLLTQNKSRSLDLRKVTSYNVDPVPLLGTASHNQTSSERENLS